MSKPRKIAVLGGGIGSLSAIFELTSLPGWKVRFEITVYQMGWQLGGKGASGRNESCYNRNEEHGLHVWLGFYDNAFDIIMRCYEDLNPALGHRFKTWSDAFEPLDKFVLVENGNDRIDYPLPPKSDKPGKRKKRPYVYWDYAIQLSGLLANRFEQSGLINVMEESPPPGEFSPSNVGPAGEPRKSSKNDGRTTSVDAVINNLGRRLEALPENPNLLSAADRSSILRDLNLVTVRLNQHNRESLVANSTYLAYWELLEIGFGILRGMIADDVITGGFEAIDDVEWTDWLLGHGVHEQALYSAPARAAYDLVFGYVAGDEAKRSVSAAVGTHCLIRMLLDYRGSVAYQLKSGMGEAVFAPLYLVLRDRGVKFEFFHRIDRITASTDGKRVEQIDFVRQARTLDGLPYSPLISVKGLKCWPTAPLFGQLKDRAVVEADGFRSAAADGIRESGSLRRGSDFDDVILNIPQPVLKSITSDLANASPAWRDMLEKISSTATMSAQIWTVSKPAQLGFTSDGRLLGAYKKPYDTVWDGHKIINNEAFPSDSQPNACMYLCGSYPASTASRATSPIENARHFTRNWFSAPGIFARLDAGQPGAAFDWNWLYDPLNAAGAARLDWQHVSANTEAWQRYVQSFPGTAKYRLRSDQSGFDNLYLSGDWTRTALNAGCMEAAVMSGLRAARAISGENIPISGEDEQTGDAPAPIDLIVKEIARIDDGVGSVDAIGVLLALTTEEARRILPSGLELIQPPSVPMGTHPLGVLFCHHWGVRPALAPSLFGASYDELAFALPFVRLASTGADSEPSTVLPLLMLNDLLAAGGGLLLGFNKRLARLSVRGDRRSAASAFRGIELVSIDATPAGAAGKAGTFPRFGLARQVFQQPVLVQRLGMWRRITMDFNLDTATITPMTGKMKVHRHLLDGLGVTTYDLPSIETSTFGAFAFTSDWHLDGRLIPVR